jgi:hypothetical protein
MIELEGTVDDYASLSLRDLLEARDLYHFHLMNCANVVGTAVGRYLIRKAGVPPKARRTFANSEVHDNSWPCVLVLVSDWVDESEFRSDGGRLHPTDIVPTALYLPDGRKVPVCVVAVEQAVPAPAKIPDWVWPPSTLGPGFPVFVDVQGQERQASVGALVSDGHKLYGLTNRHVCGVEGEPIYAIVRSRPVLVGRTSAKQGTRVLFSEAYPDFPSRRTYVNLDVGLFELEDASMWTSQVYGLGTIGPIADLNEANIRLRLIDAKVVAFGAASGALEGRITGLFYRYKSVAGFDYVADFLIAPAEGQGTQPGDSGTVWHLVPKDDPRLLRPIAVEWGGQAFAFEGEGQHHFALATSLSTVCKQLDVDLVRADNAGPLPYWGQTGHYDIATFACNEISSPNLRTLMDANLDRVSFARNSLDAKDIANAIQEAKAHQGFVPLADVPDIVWKNLPGKFPGGRDDKPGPHGSTGPEHPNHFADIDEPWAGNGGKTLRDLCVADHANVSVPVWQRYYDSNDHKTQPSRGLLPFRVWQHFNAMVDALRGDGNLERFVAAAGTLSHYVGDACQPLHGSMNADGNAATHAGTGVHAAYESKMIDRYSTEIVARYAQGRAHAAADPLDPVASGRDAAIATVNLMARTARRIPPLQLIQTFIDAGGKPNNTSTAAMWKAWGDLTIDVIADGARVLAFLWDAAWRIGDGDRLGAGPLVAFEPERLRQIYESADFVPSLDLDHVGAAIQ